MPHTSPEQHCKPLYVHRAQIVHWPHVRDAQLAPSAPASRAGGAEAQPTDMQGYFLSGAMCSVLSIAKVGQTSLPRQGSRTMSAAVSIVHSPVDVPRLSALAIVSKSAAAMAMARIRPRRLAEGADWGCRQVKSSQLNVSHGSDRRTPTSLGMVEAAFPTEERGEGRVVALGACTHARSESRSIGVCGTLGVRVISLFCCKLHYLYTRKLQ
jgi:hypothetical protein